MTHLIRNHFNTPGRWTVAVLAVLALVAVVFSTPRNAGATSSVSGTVKDPSNAAVANVEVCFNGISGGGCDMTDVSGQYNLSLNPGHYRTQTRVPSGTNFGPAVEVEVDVFDGQTLTTNFTLTLLEVKGTLKKSDGSVVQGWVNAHTSDWSTQAHSDSDQNGYFTIGGLPEGDYMIETGSFGNVSGVIPPDPVTIHISPSSPQTLDLVYKAAAKTLIGTVKKSNGAVVTDACIDANKVNGGTHANTHVDSTGSFTMSLSGGSWSVMANPCGQTVDWISGNGFQVDFEDSTAVESKTLNLTVTVASAVVTGTVKDSAGNLITTGDIDVRNSSGVGAHAQVQSDGTYRVNVTAGTYDIHFWSPSNAYNLPQTTVTVGDNQTVTQNLVLTTKSAHIQGCVKTKAGVPAANVPVNAWQMTGPSGGPGGWGYTRTAADCTYDMLVTAGKYGLNIPQEPGSSYVLVTQGPPTEVTVATETSVVTGVDFTVDNADVTITGSITASGQPIPNANGCVYARPAGSFAESCGPIDPRSGTFTIKVSSSVASVFEVGCHFPPNMPFSCGTPIKVTVTAGATVQQNIDVLANNSTLIGRLFDSSGFPLKSCEKLKGGMIFADGEGVHYQGQIESNCSYQIALIAGVYHVGAFFPPESGALNPPPGQPIQIFNGQTVERNIQFTSADASIAVSLLDQNGVGTQGYIMVDNAEEINQSREGNQGPGGPPGKGAERGFDKNTPCQARDFKGVFQCCSDAKNKSACTAFKVPDGPNGCKNAWDCVQLCKKDQSLCKDAQSNTDQGPKPGETFTGPGGCKSESECQKYCSVPDHQSECAKFAPPPSAQSLVRISSVRVRASSESGTASKSDDKGPGFDNAIRSGGPTDFQGHSKIAVLSGHRYKVCAGLPPQSNAMPPKCQTVDLTKVTSATVTLQLRQSDATISGVVSFNGSPVDRCFVHAWAEDGSFSGQPCDSGGNYRINLTKDTTWHIGADSFRDTTFYRSDEITKVVTDDTKAYTQNITLTQQDFEIPHPVTTTSTCSDTMTLGLSNGAKVEVPSGAISTSTTGTCTCTASPTIEMVATKANQPEGVGYTIECRDENNAVVQKLLSSATITLPYKISSDQEGTSYEDGLQAAFYDSTLGAYQTLDNCTKNETNDTFACRVDHFSSYTVSNATGTSASGAALKTVTTSTSKSKVTSFTVGSKKVTPFPSCRGQVNVVTKSVRGKQLIATGADCGGTVKVYNTSGKVTKQVNTGWRGVSDLGFVDVNKDGIADVIATPTSGREVWVINAAKKYSVTKVTVAGRASDLTATAIDFRGNGIASLVAATVTKGQATGFKVFDYKKGKFTASSTSYAAYLKNNNGGIALSIPKPTVSSVSKSSISSSGKAKLTLKGSNFTPDTTVLLGSVGTKVSFKSTSQLEVTVDGTKLSTGKFSFKLTNPGGQSVTSKQKLTVK